MTTTITTPEEIATALNELVPYTFEPKTDKYGNVTIVAKGSNGLGFWLRTGGYGNEGRTTIAYDRPRDVDGSYLTVWSKVAGGGQLSNPTITVAADKSAAKIAGDIVRRLLPESVNLHVQVVDTLKANADYELAKITLTHQIEDAIGAKASNTGIKYANPTIDPYDVLPIAKSDYRAGYGEITVSSNSADIKLTSVPPALAVELAKVITNTLKAYVARTAK